MTYLNKDYRIYRVLKNKLHLHVQKSYVIMILTNLSLVQYLLENLSKITAQNTQI